MPLSLERGTIIVAVFELLCYTARQSRITRLDTALSLYLLAFQNFTLTERIVTPRIGSENLVILSKRYF